MSKPIKKVLTKLNFGINAVFSTGFQLNLIEVFTLHIISIAYMVLFITRVIFSSKIGDLAELVKPKD